MTTHTDDVQLLMTWWWKYLIKGHGGRTDGHSISSSLGVRSFAAVRLDINNVKKRSLMVMLLKMMFIVMMVMMRRKDEKVNLLIACC